MRIASFQFIQRNLDNISARSSEAHRQLGQMSSSKRVDKPSDDPVSANGILNYKQELRKIEQYQNNINLAENRLRREETGLTSGENITQQVKEIMLKANNPAITQNERDAFKSELQSRIDEMLDIANSKDEFGQAIFGGFQTDSDPFTFDDKGNIVYSGDSGQRQMVIGDSVKVELNHDGELVFGGVPNPRGDFTVDYSGVKGESREDQVRVESINIVDRASFSDQKNYSVEFVGKLPADPESEEIFYVVKDATGTPIAPTDPTDPLTQLPYDPLNPIAVDGIEIKVKGDVKIGDEITLNSSVQDGTGQDDVGVFDILNRAKQWLETDGHTAKGQSEMIDILDELDAMGGHFTQVRADTGNRMQRLDNQKETHSEMTLTLDKLRSGMEDLDYAKAAGEFSQTMVALQATQTMFGKIQNMSLFNYI
ncbi:flagellar hook-associated protein FlgL [Oceanisphaera marina]|uniref:Flagellar hook-associated protein FlgL n=1 Tax=Oceanisphaera marina TaxID=2017550 RepID=A0ABQ1IMH0_9GAMM|nr:flagellar hook-associated protein FlgL [Oceanisphaera marina]GGB45048.1 flagellar hook-associated protein FlgL [Oceanisphaera marina]